MARNWGKVKNVEVEYRTSDEHEIVITLTCVIECVKDFPKESIVLSAIAQTDDERDWLPDLKDWQKDVIINKALSEVDWSEKD